MNSTSALNAANALNFILAAALLLACAQLHFASSGGSTAVEPEAAVPAPGIAGSDGPEIPGFDFHGGAALPPPAGHATGASGGTASPSDFALAALGAPTPAAVPGTGEAGGEAAAGAFRDFDPRTEFEGNPFEIFTGAGMLLCAGDRESSNAMTIGWGGLGTLWGRNDAVTVYVAEARHTRQFMDRASHFTVMAFDKERQRRILEYMGHNSGRDGDKAAALGLHVAFTENGTPYYEEARMVIECETMYAAPFDRAAMKEVPKKLYSNFPAGVHTMYIGRIVKAMRRP